MAAHEFYPGKVQVWLMAIRPKTLPAAVGPVLVGIAAAYHDGFTNLLVSILALLGAISLQIESNLVNDYFDHKSGVDNEKRMGPVRVMQKGLLNEREMQIGIIVNIAISALIGLYLIYVGGLPILAIGVASIVFAILYSGGPFPLSSHAMGDIFVFLFFGMVAVPGTYYVISKTVNILIFVLSIPVGFLVTAILVVNNYRDFDVDKEAGKLTLAHVFGKNGTKIYYSVLIYASYLIPIALWFFHSFSWTVLLPILSLPLAISNSNTLWKETNLANLNVTLAKTAKLSLIYSLLFAVGIVLS